MTNTKNSTKDSLICQEVWNGFTIRYFVKDTDAWYFAVDLCAALDIQNPANAVAEMCKRLELAGIDIATIYTKCPVENYVGKGAKTQKMLCVDEAGLYELVFVSRKKEAVQFRHWIASELLPMIRKELSITAGQLLYKEKQKAAMERLFQGLKAPEPKNYAYVNWLANETTSAKHHIGKTINKAAMDVAMLEDRQVILDDVTNLTILKETYGLDIDVRALVRNKYVKGA